MLTRLTTLLGLSTSLNIDTAFLSKTGGRDHNEDYQGKQPLENGNSCWIVADGLGGHGAGEIAAQLAVQTIIETFTQQSAISAENIRYLLNQANQQLLSAQLTTPNGKDMASTVVALLLDDRHAVWAHSGDSRLYRFRAKSYQLLTTDHSMAQLLIRMDELDAEQLRHHPDRNTLLHCLGRDSFYIDVSKIEKIRAGDVFLLCSDGFWEYVLEQEMLDDLHSTTSLTKWLFSLEQKLLNRVAEQGKLNRHDNYTALAVKIKKP
ncbi:MAG: serine/threonine-protein phosphatase [Methylococcales bacterium]